MQKKNAASFHKLLSEQLSLKCYDEQENKKIAKKTRTF